MTTCPKSWQPNVSHKRRGTREAELRYGVAMRATAPVERASLPAYERLEIGGGKQTVEIWYYRIGSDVVQVKVSAAQMLPASSRTVSTSSTNPISGYPTYGVPAIPPFSVNVPNGSEPCEGGVVEYVSELSRFLHQTQRASRMNSSSWQRQVGAFKCCMRPLRDLRIALLWWRICWVEMLSGVLSNPTMPDGRLSDVHIICRGFHDRSTSFWEDCTETTAPISEIDLYFTPPFNALRFHFV
ncbi:uncharacterized protein LACBIDRAFT_330253 [Laccaria bicolor S238N-H82]|uniref:Predicted protein n=1 Tax=Laccaria bicolor (strain S238N-H82 / ATCC MYA-4686) TaxID=486041 RepID=B0DKP9_LACBS|nr:uncharacterized protein LACBIDRAFT_330253 [Laccaria bicolor S238N-H82]EDR04683.1 predicted protein [Laccaria bicolor S238N-H82]|eukprot:XP_001884507.1 predicted protein [Laccaria bicolor S238N-H82]